MKKRRNTTPLKPKLTQDQVDRLVTAQADEDSAWQKAIVVRRPKSASLSIHHVDDAPHIPHFGGKVAIEAAIRKSGIDYTILRPNNFYQNDDGLKDTGGARPPTS